MDNKQLAQPIAALRPGIRRLFVAAYPAMVVAQRGVLGDGVNSLQKHVAHHALIAEVRNVLERR